VETFGALVDEGPKAALQEDARPQEDAMLHGTGPQRDKGAQGHPMRPTTLHVPAVSDHNAHNLALGGALLTPLSLLIMTGPSLCSTKSDGRQMHLEKRSGERDGGSYA